MEKSLSFLILIGIGIVFRTKVSNKEQVGTIKNLILTVALPAVILSALLKINLNASLIYPPLMVLGCNFLMFWAVRDLLPFFIRRKVNTDNRRTFMLVLPSFAPYLSCFPFLAEFANQEVIGTAAIADTGNKLFILIFLYFIAMYWTYGRKLTAFNSNNSKKGSGFKKLFDVLLQPINFTLIVALSASLMGYRLDSLPSYFQDSLLYLRNLLTPCILIFVGLAVKVKGKEFQLIMGLLLWRSGVAFAISAIAIFFLKLDSVATTMLIVAFPQSSCSFLPYAQMSVFYEFDRRRRKIFNPELALSLLAISLPFSSFTIVSIYSTGNFFTAPINLFSISAIALGISLVLLRQPEFFQRKVNSSANSDSGS